MKTKHQQYIQSVLDHIAKGGKIVFNRSRRGKVMSVEKRLEVQIIDKIEQKVQHVLRSYENNALEDKLIDLVKEWFFKGFFCGRDYEMRNEDMQRKVSERITPNAEGTQYVMLDEKDFKCLVGGGVLGVGVNLKIALRDIGFDEMFRSINLATSEESQYQDRQKEA